MAQVCHLLVQRADTDVVGGQLGRMRVEPLVECGLELAEFHDRPGLPSRFFGGRRARQIVWLPRVPGAVAT